MSLNLKFNSNRARSRFTRIAFSLIISLALVAVSRARASMPREDYLKALKIAQGKVDREKEARGAPGALSSSVIKALFGRYYQVGDRWTVAAWYERSNQARMTSDPAALSQQNGAEGIFEYVVTDVKTGITPQVVLEVTQKSQFGLSVPDPKVKFLRLTMNDQMLQDKKAYSIEGHSDLVNVSPDGIHSGITMLELFPLDVPELITAARQEVDTTPTLPAALDPIARTVGFHPDLTRSQWFEQDDFFGRPVQVLWQTGDPWPSYLRTTNGTAILISKSTS